MSDGPPRAAFHLALTVPAVLLLYGFSVPGLAVVTVAVAAVALLVGAVVWAVWLVAYVVGRRRGTAGGSAWWLLVAPLGGLLVVGLVMADVPLRVRWAGSKAAFERAARLAPPPVPRGEDVLFDAPDRIGSYDVTLAYRIGDAVLFQERNGALFDDAGFAYLPSGPFPELSTGSVEGPRFRPLGDGWFAYTASW